MPQDPYLFYTGSPGCGLIGTIIPTPSTQSKGSCYVTERVNKSMCGLVVNLITPTICSIYVYVYIRACVCIIRYKKL